MELKSKCAIQVQSKVLQKKNKQINKTTSKSETRKNKQTSNDANVK